MRIITKAYSIHPWHLSRYGGKFPFILESTDTAIVIKEFDPDTLEIYAPICTKQAYLEGESPFYYHECDQEFAYWLEEYLHCGGWEEFENTQETCISDNPPMRQRELTLIDSKTHDIACGFDL